jgi:HAD superfamily phosphoserine phosphatase-like hydrolase
MKNAYCFDLDGTLTSIEILPCIASELGVAEEIATLTRLTMSGLISFDESMRLRCLILGQVPIERVHEIVETIPLDPFLADFVAERADDCFVVTGNLDVWIEPLIRRLGCRSYTSRAAFDTGKLMVEHVLDKGVAVGEIRALGYDRILAVGDGANDVPMLRRADAAIAFGGVHSPMPTAVKESHFVAHDGNSLCKLLTAL